MTDELKKARKLLGKVLDENERNRYKEDIENIMEGRSPEYLVTSYDTLRGSVLALPLLHFPKVTVLKAYLESDTEVDFHCHEEREWIIVYDGELWVTCQGQYEGKKISEGQHVIFQPGDNHKVWTGEAPSGCIIVTWPGSENFESIHRCLKIKDTSVDE